MVESLFGGERSTQHEDRAQIDAREVTERGVGNTKVSACREYVSGKCPTLKIKGPLKCVTIYSHILSIGTLPDL